MPYFPLGYPNLETSIDVMVSVPGKKVAAGVPRELRDQFAFFEFKQPSERGWYDGRSDSNLRPRRKD